jgi:primosomal protein N' (replication factor Y)
VGSEGHACGRSAVAVGPAWWDCGVDVSAEQPALAGLAPRRRRPKPVEPLADHLPVARVVVDRPVPHLDQVFDYGVPASMSDSVRAGVRVRVRLGKQDVDGFCVERAAASAFGLVPLRRVVSGEVVLTPPVLGLCRAVARRWVGTLADVLRLAVPPRHARVEAETAPDPSIGDAGCSGRPDDAPTPGPARGSATVWDAYPGGAAFLRRLADGEAPRGVWQALPGPEGSTWADGIAVAVGAAVEAGRGALVVVPSAAEVASVEAAFARHLQPSGSGAPGWVRLSADDGPAARYRAFLAVVRGEARVVVGTRGAAFAPVARLGLAVCWDDASDLHLEPRAPYTHVREILALRSELEGCALLVGGYIRSVAAQRWIGAGWAHPLVAARTTVRERVARVTALTSSELVREGSAAAARLPGPAWRATREALERGPVLVQVPRAGYFPAVACQTCRAQVRCPVCAGPVEVGASGAVPGCRWCGRVATDWRCGECGGVRLRSVRVGSDRTAEELGRAFPGFRVHTSGAAAGILATVPDRPAIVVATFGAEPVAPRGYAAALLLDAAVVTGRPALDVAEQALRAWTSAASLVRPASAGGVVLLVGDAAPVPTQALVRWDPAWLAERELAERTELSLPPAVHVAVLDGPRDAVAGLLARTTLPAESQVVGPTPRRADPSDADVEVLVEPEGERAVRALVRTPWAQAGAVADALVGSVGTRSARREQPVRIRMEPTEVW